jgi:hypothetical protein
LYEDLKLKMEKFGKLEGKDLEEFKRLEAQFG